MIREVFENEPAALAMEMLDTQGQTYTCYWETSRNDRACMIGAMQDDDWLDFIEANRDVIKDILENDDDIDGEDDDVDDNRSDGSDGA